MSDSLLLEISNLIKTLRKEKNLTQDELAYRAGLDRTYISGVERGIRNLTINSLESIISALEVSPEYFFKRLNIHFSESKGASLNGKTT